MKNKTKSSTSVVVSEWVNAGARNFMLFLWLQNLNSLLLQQRKHSKYMHARCLNCLCFINYLLAHINAPYKFFMQAQLWYITSKMENLSIILTVLRHRLMNAMHVQGCSSFFSLWKSVFLCFLASKENEQLKIWLISFDKIEILDLDIGAFRNNSKNWKNYQNLPFWIQKKSALFRAVSRLNQRCSKIFSDSLRWIVAGHHQGYFLN